jgi:hypothetical protein
LNDIRRDSNIPGEEYVPADFVPVTRLPGAVNKIRNLIFGDTPDRIMLNYRLRQLMPLWHETELEEFVLAFDPRITYWPNDRSEFYKTAFVPRVTTQHGGQLTLIGQHEPDENAGRLEQKWKVSLTSGTTVRVSQLLPPFRSEIHTISFSGNLSSLFSLTGSSLQATVDGPIGADWFVNAVARPVRSMGDILATLKVTVTGSDEVTLFGAAPSGNLKTWRDLWRDHPWYGYQLGGLMLAVANAINENR